MADTSRLDTGDVNTVFVPFSTHVPIKTPQGNLSRIATRSDRNGAVQLHKMVRCLKFQIKEVEGLYFLCSENKGADQLRS